jgi:hypothetical protein
MEGAELNVRTVSAILVWVVAVLLMLNNYFRSELLFYGSIAMLVVAILVYFIPRLRKQKT